MPEALSQSWSPTSVAILPLNTQSSAEQLAEKCLFNALRSENGSPRKPTADGSNRFMSLASPALFLVCSIPTACAIGLEECRQLHWLCPKKSHSQSTQLANRNCAK